MRSVNYTSWRSRRGSESSCGNIDGYWYFRRGYWKRFILVWTDHSNRRIQDVIVWLLKKPYASCCSQLDSLGWWTGGCTLDCACRFVVSSSYWKEYHSLFYALRDNFQKLKFIKHYVKRKQILLMVEKSVFRRKIQLIFYEKFEFK